MRNFYDSLFNVDRLNNKFVVMDHGRIPTVFQRGTLVQSRWEVPSPIGVIIGDSEETTNFWGYRITVYPVLVRGQIMKIEEDEMELIWKE